MRRGLIGGGVLALLWFVCGWLPHLLYSLGGSMATLSQLIPSPMMRGVFGSPVLWAAIVQVLMALVLVGGFATLATWFAAGSATGLGTRRAVFAAGWLAAILTAFAVGAVLDLGDFFSWVGTFGVRGAIGTMGATPLTAWWAVLLGWVPALVLVLVPRSSAVAADAAAVADADAAADANAEPSRPSAGRVAPAAAVLAVVALLALPFAAIAGDAATQAQLRDEQATAQQQADPDRAAAPDPSASGDPVPPAAPSEGDSIEGACTSANTTILAPAPDGATGHRGQALSLVNVSEEACVVEGYPDIAYGDQNGHLLDVTVEHGRSFMAEDPGPSSITLQPGEAATAVIGWDANSVHGQLAARSLWIAVRPGEERLSWDVSLDIIPGSTVHVTAWHPEVLPAG